MTDSEEHARRVRQRAADAKERELSAHRRAAERHEEAARLQDRFGHPDLAAAARTRAEHARELGELAQAEKEAVAEVAAPREPTDGGGAGQPQDGGVDRSDGAGGDDAETPAPAVTLREDEGVADSTAG